MIYLILILGVFALSVVWMSLNGTSAIRGRQPSTSSVREILSLMPARTDEEAALVKWVMDDSLRCEQALLVNEFLGDLLGEEATANFLLRCAEDASLNQPDEFGAALCEQLQAEMAKVMTRSGENTGTVRKLLTIGNNLALSLAEMDRKESSSGADGQPNQAGISRDEARTAPIRRRRAY